jgi:hypothetical protein
VAQGRRPGQSLLAVPQPGLKKSVSEGVSAEESGGDLHSYCFSIQKLRWNYTVMTLRAVRGPGRGRTRAARRCKGPDEGAVSFSRRPTCLVLCMVHH